MNKSTVFDCSLLELPKIKAASGSITSINNFKEIPFGIKRTYYLYDLPSASSRGGHAHKDLHQLIIAASGSFDVMLQDGRMKRAVQLNQPNIGLYLPPGLWRELSNFSNGAICLVLASELYTEEDYIREYDQFLAYKSL
ncbi:FdtA/QdtA family cupin domain-containing protein [uncultured Imperialibacter sp.]|uniref:sugar 3,4-ketoisomerase n=1 Tax=uncultured Imperialibacter sp. TaxID=1672639 RepID=UPI0030D78365